MNYLLNREQLYYVECKCVKEEIALLSMVHFRVKSFMYVNKILLQASPPH